MRYRFCPGRPLFLVPTLGLAIGLTGAGRADFVPGRLYLSANSDLASCEEGLNDRIYEFDPATGNSRIFSETPDDLCGFTTGLTFTPDGNRLRSSIYFSSTIAQIDGSGNMSRALGPADGVYGPLGGNNIGYNAAGDFFMADSSPRILRFPAAGGPAQVYGDFSSGVSDGGPIALAPDGDLYYGDAASSFFREIRRFTGPGESEIFDTLPAGTELASLAVDSAENIFALTDDGVYRYDGGDPSSRRLLTPGLSLPSNISSIALSIDENTVYVARPNRVLAVDAQTGSFTTHPLEITDEFLIGYGIAVAVPEPSSLTLLWIVVIAFACLTRRGFLRKETHR